QPDVVGRRGTGDGELRGHEDRAARDGGGHLGGRGGLRRSRRRDRKGEHKTRRREQPEQSTSRGGPRPARPTAPHGPWPWHPPPNLLLVPMPREGSKVPASLSAECPRTKA